MKTYLHISLSVLSVFAPLSVAAQIPTLEWVIKNETNNDDMGKAIAIDDHSVYTTGFFKGEVDFDPATQEGGGFPQPGWRVGDETTGDNNVFVQKLDTAGVLEWAAMFGGAEDDEGRGIAVDPLGNVYVTGVFRDSARFTYYQTTDPAYLLGAGKKDAFVIKLSSEGDLLWAVSIGGAGDDMARAIALDSIGNVFITGRFSETVDFDPGPGISEHTANGGSDIFILKLDSSGQYRWAVAMGGQGVDGGTSIDVDGSGNVYTTGYFSNTVDLNPGSDTLDITSEGGTDIFVQKLNAQGVLVWAGSMGGTDNDEGKTVRAGDGDHLFVNGSFMQTADLDPSPSSSTHTSNGGRDIFVCRLDTSGTLDWAATMGGTDHDAPTGMDIDPDGNVLSVGYFQEEVDFDPGVGVDSYTSIGFKDMFWQKLNADGELLWAAQVGGYTDQLAKAVATGPQGLTVTTGGYQNPLVGPLFDFDPSPTDEFLVSSNTVDLFVQCLDGQGVFRWATYSKGVCCGGFDQYIDTDPDGNLIVAGHFAVRMDADPGPAELFFNSKATFQRTDIFVQKLDENGELLWARHLKGVNGENRVYQLDVDEAGNIYVAGRFQDTMDLDPGPGVFELFAEHYGGINQNADVFILKLNPEGEFVWAKQFVGDGSADNICTFLGVDNDQNVYLTGAFGGMIDFDPGPDQYLLDMDSNPLYSRPLIKLNADGNLEWFNLQMDTTSSTGSIGVAAIRVSPDGTIRYYGYYDGVVDLDLSPSESLLPLPDGNFFSTMNSDGQLLSVVTLPYGFGFGGNFSRLWDDEGNLYLFGMTDDTMDLDPGPGVFEVMDDQLGETDRFLLKLNAAGTFLWARHFETGSDGRLWGYPILDSFGNLLVIAGLEGGMDVEPGIGETFLQAEPEPGQFGYDYDPCVLSMDTSGAFQWAFRYGNMLDWDAIDQAAVHGEYIFAQGDRFNGRIDFDTSSDTVFLNSYNSGHYMVKWKRDDLVSIDQEPILTKNELRLFPNPATDRVTIQWPRGVGASGIELHAANGQVLEQVRINDRPTYYQLSLNYPSGFYTIRLRTDKRIFNAKLIVR